MGDKDAVMTSANVNSELNTVPKMSWEERLPDESSKAFKAFCLFRAMGYKRSIKACMEMHGIEPKKYGSWARYARLFRWNERAAEYDAYIAKETERELLAERVERKKRQMEMLNGFDELVGKDLRLWTRKSLMQTELWICLNVLQSWTRLLRVQINRLKSRCRENWRLAL